MENEPINLKCSNDEYHLVMRIMEEYGCSQFNESLHDDDFIKVIKTIDLTKFSQEEQKIIIEYREIIGSLPLSD